MANTNVGYALGALSGLLQGIDQIAQRRKAEQVQALSILGQQPGAAIGQAENPEPANFLQRILGTTYKPTATGAPVINFGGIPITVSQQPNPIAALLAGGTQGQPPTLESYTQNLLEADQAATQPPRLPPLQEGQGGRQAPQQRQARFPTITPAMRRVADYLGATEEEIQHPLLKAALANPRTATPDAVLKTLAQVREAQSQEAQRQDVRESRALTRQQAQFEQSRKIAEQVGSLLYDVSTPEQHAEAIAEMRALGTIPEEFIQRIETYDPERNKRVLAASLDVSKRLQLDESKARREETRVRGQENLSLRQERLDEQRQARLAEAQRSAAKDIQQARDNFQDNPDKLVEIEKLNKDIQALEDPQAVYKALAKIPIGKQNAALIRDREKAVIEANAKLNTTPLDPRDRDAISDLNTLIRSINDIDKLYDPSFTGRIQGPTGAVRVFTGNAKDAEVQFRRLLKDMQDFLLRERSMSSTTENEFLRLSKLAPDPYIASNSFLPTLRGFARSVETARDSLLELATQSRAESKETAPRTNFSTELPPSKGTQLPRREPPAGQTPPTAPSKPQTVTPAQAQQELQRLQKLTDAELDTLAGKPLTPAERQSIREKIKQMKPADAKRVLEQQQGGR